MQQQILEEPGEAGPPSGQKRLGQRRGRDRRRDERERQEAHQEVRGLHLEPTSSTIRAEKD